MISCDFPEQFFFFVKPLVVNVIALSKKNFVILVFRLLAIVETKKGVLAPSGKATVAFQLLCTARPLRCTQSERQSQAKQQQAGTANQTANAEIK